MLSLRLFLLLLLPVALLSANVGCFTGSLTKAEADRNYMQKLTRGQNFSKDCMISISGSPSDYKLQFGLPDVNLRYKNVCTKKDSRIVCVCHAQFSSDCNTIEWFLTTPTKKMVENPLYKKTFDDLLAKFYPDSKENFLLGHRPSASQEETEKDEINKEYMRIKLRNIITMIDLEKPLANMHWSRVSLILSMVMLYFFAFYVFAVQAGVSRRLKKYFKLKKLQNTKKAACQPEHEYSCRAPSPSGHDDSSVAPSGDSASHFK